MDFPTHGKKIDFLRKFEHFHLVFHCFAQSFPSNLLAKNCAKRHETQLENGQAFLSPGIFVKGASRLCFGKETCF